MLLLFSSTILLQGCETLRYYSQAIHGQLKILQARQSITEVLADDSVNEHVKIKLNLITEAKQFAKQELSLPTKKLYTSYVQLDNPYVVWNVFAAPRFSVSPKTWCFPIIGCLSYRGYFAEEDAQEYATKLRKEGYDVFVGGIAAYSTLGWFDDPVLSSFFNRRDEYLAGLIFHELSHQLLYFDGDTTFNESFATTVELEGLKRFLDHPQKKALYDNYVTSQHRRQQFIKLVIVYRDKLDKLYQLADNDETKLERKKQMLLTLKAEYRSLSQDWPNPDIYKHWFNTQLNNAKLNTLATYHSLVKPLQVLLGQHQHNLASFYKACLAMEDWDQQRRHNYLFSLKSN
ncbi:MAG: aminopeptidase [Pseudomonadales bacterium]|nr:aminopeptidase [Pseudomonadales bacterium]